MRALTDPIAKTAKIEIQGVAKSYPGERSPVQAL